MIGLAVEFLSNQLGEWQQPHDDTVCWGLQENGILQIAINIEKHPRTRFAFELSLRKAKEKTKETKLRF